MKKEVHSINGKVQGAWYELEDGRKCYLAYRTPRHFHRVKMSWLFEEGLLRRCAAMNCRVVGVALKRGGKTFFYMTPLADLHDPALSFSVMDNKAGVCRALPGKLFKINPGNDPEMIARITLIQ